MFVVLDFFCFQMENKVNLFRKTLLFCRCFELFLIQLFQNKLVLTVCNSVYVIYCSLLLFIRTLFILIESKCDLTYVTGLFDRD